VVIAFITGFAVGSLFISWFTFSQNQHAYSKLEQRMKQVDAHLSGFDNAFDTVSVELRQLKMALDNNERFYANDPVAPDINRPNDEDLSDINSNVDADSVADDRLASEKTDTLDEQELSRVTLVVDKLRAHDTMAFPDLPSLMASPEVANMSPAALDKILAEVSRMVEQGQLDPSFFPHR
jgi:hypothetical protein